MRNFKTDPILNIFNHYLIDAPEPSNISYLWNFGSLLGTCLVIQIMTGIFLGMHYTPHIDFAFSSVEHIMRDVNMGWFIRYVHANTASFFFIFVYIHIGRGLYYGSYKKPRFLAWSIGVVILFIMMGTAFLGYVLPYGQMSLWGATVITNLLSAIPWIGQDFVEFVWGGFSVNNATINRFFSLHYVFPFVISLFVILHILAIHEQGSNNPLGISGNTDRISFYPYFVFKDLITIFFFMISISIFIFYLPNILGHSDNFIPANSMVTPSSIVPEWYLLPFYAILRSIESKIFGVITMFASIVVLLFIPFFDISTIRANIFRPINQIFFWTFIVNFIILMFIGSQHVESPYTEIGVISTFYYFFWFLIIVPGIGFLENIIKWNEMKWN